MDTVAWEEYKVLQGKIDKIGEFHFLIRGWAVTLVAGLLISVGSQGNIAEMLAGVPLVGLFQMIEAHQNRWQRAFGRRLSELERGIRSPNDPTRAPRIAGTIIAASESMRRGGPFDRILLRAPLVFYLSMYAFVVAAFLFQLKYRETDSKKVRIEFPSPPHPKVMIFESPPNQPDSTIVRPPSHSTQRNRAVSPGLPGSTRRRGRAGVPGRGHE